MSQNKMNQEVNKGLNLKSFSDARNKRAEAILKKGEPETIDEYTYLVPSQFDSSKKYKVTHLDSYSCECEDFKQRCQGTGLYCKHIKAIILFNKVKSKVELDDLDINKEINKQVCPYCSSEKIFKRGNRKTKTGNKQVYCCKECNKRFVLEPIKYIKGNAKLVCLAMDCYFKGNSLRDIQDMFKQFYSLEISHETIRRWINRFTKIMDNYTKKLKPEIGNRWHTDEQNIKVVKEWLWSWNTIDRDTRFWLANNVTTNRKINDARQIFKQAKETAGEIPEDLELVTDGLHSYKKAIKKEFTTKKDMFNRTKKGNTTHIGNAGIKKEINNNMVERLHNEFREFDKVRRGFYSIETAQNNLNGMKLYHNFIKKNMALNGLTPSQKANIDLELDNNRWLSLLLMSLKNDKG